MQSNGARKTSLTSGIAVLALRALTVCSTAPDYDTASALTMAVERDVFVDETAFER